MAILIDPPLWPAHGTLWSHLITDTELAELHAFATGRSAILEHYLDRPAIYLTERAHDLWESRARTNLTREREMLSQSVG